MSEPDSPTTPDPEADAGTGESADGTGTGGSTTTRNRIVAGFVVVAVLAALGYAVFAGGGDDTAAPTSTTSSTAVASSAPVTRPAEISKVATVKASVPRVQVLSSPPPGWDTATPVEAWKAEALPASQDSMEPRDALPRVDYPIQGRYATPTGWEFSNPTSFDGPMTFLVTETRGEWAKVLLPVRPNHTEGWVKLSDLDISESDYRIELRLGERRLTAYKGTEVIAETPVVIGKDATRTPTGRFFVTDKITKDNPDGAYGPFILPLNGYSEQLDTFDDGVPVIAMHGTNQPELLGQNASNGCIRMPNDVITKLHDQLPLGTQVEVFA